MAYRWTADSIGNATLLDESRRVTVIRSPSVSRFSLVKSLSELVRYRDLLYTLTAHRIKVRYKQSILGISWAIIQPISMMLMFTVVFSLIARMPSGGVPYAIFAYVALLPWNVFSSSVTNATGGLVSHSQLITKVYFPREILPITYVLAALVDFLIGSTALAVMMIYYRVPLTATALYALPIVAVLTLFSLSISLILAATHVRFRDIGMAMPLLLQLWMFATPIIYPVSAVPERLRTFYSLNPLVPIIESFRQVLLLGTTPDFGPLGRSCLISIILLVASYLYFKRVEATMADVI
ncbi:MAG: ABC transporter permease [Blastocatellia bacterium]